MKAGVDRIFRVWNVLISLKLAVLVIAGLALTLASATILESKYDTKTAQYYVYRAGWFYALLTLLGLNILAVALSRLPWKKKHIPFLMAHAGILMILSGSWLTYVRGLDGSIRISEGEVSSTVELDEHVLVLRRDGLTQTRPFPWMPQAVAESFKGLSLPEFGVRVERYLADAEPKVRFLPATVAGEKNGPAVQIRILGAPMGGAPELWLWSGDPGWASQRMGPARFLVRNEDQKDLAASTVSGEARLDFIAGPNGSLRFEAVSPRGERKSGKIDLQRLTDRENPVVVDPGWRMPIRVQVKSFISKARNQSEYQPRTVKPQGMGSAQPEPAIQVSLISKPEARIWLGLGDQADFIDEQGLPLSLSYFPKQIFLPFGLRLKRFEMKTNPGTMDPAAYSSYVQVVEGLKKTEIELDALPVRHITMNEPLDESGHTFYQASYIPEMPRPVTTILSVNHDPGRALKYWGSILLISGSILLYLFKTLQKKKKEPSRA